MNGVFYTTTQGTFMSIVLDSGCRVEIKMDDGEIEAFGTKLVRFLKTDKPWILEQINDNMAVE